MKILIGKVISTKMPKTATVAVERVVVHPLYRKRFKKIRKYHVHDENSVAKVGDRVKFVASRPYSKLKKWVLIEKSGERQKGAQAAKPSSPARQAGTKPSSEK